MLVAYTEQNEPFVLNSSMPHTTLHQLRTTTKFYCPQCKEPLVFKIGTFKTPHFAHLSTNHCENQFSEGETEQHLKGKEQLYHFLKSLGLQAELEAYLPTIKQRPDILINAQERRYAIEFQCSPISFERLNERNIGYNKDSIAPIWIPATPAKIVQKGIQKVALSEQTKQFLAPSDRHHYLMSYNPNLRQFFYISNLMFLHGNSYLAKIQVLPLSRQNFPFFIPKLLNKSELKQFLSIYELLKHNFLLSRVLISRHGVNDLMLRSIYELRLQINSLPSFLGIPLKGSEALKVFSIEWQIALFYFIFFTKITIADLNIPSIRFFLKWAKLPETPQSIEVVQAYCQILNSLGIQNHFQKVPAEALVERLCTHFLAMGIDY
ncbi:hypothetical protein D1B33_03145 [Lysinibacillus yapensis]|uniref:Competence protein CoiA n=1 Tax=Ureibacillus yapensis TaxID=2304605 RepID=A0A396SFP4_9BACL|nr:competence protein CoiA family protein [Lysinibacillus yapensis]RHW39862.1 hypothetical protein D1B33_03145 [Lysinibacillus yapensis]